MNAKINAQLKAELNAQMNAKLNAKIYAQLKANLNATMNAQLKAKLNAKLNAKMNAKLNAKLMLLPNDKVETGSDCKRVSPDDGCHVFLPAAVMTSSDDRNSCLPAGAPALHVNIAACFSKKCASCFIFHSFHVMKIFQRCCGGAVMSMVRTIV